MKRSNDQGRAQYTEPYCQDARQSAAPQLTDMPIRLWRTTQPSKHTRDTSDLTLMWHVKDGRLVGRWIICGQRVVRQPLDVIPTPVRATA
jgi:hypothetical protein